MKTPGMSFSACHGRRMDPVPETREADPETIALFRKTVEPYGMKLLTREEATRYREMCAALQRARSVIEKARAAFDPAAGNMSLPELIARIEEFTEAAMGITKSRVSEELRKIYTGKDQR